MRGTRRISRALDEADEREVFDYLVWPLLGLALTLIVLVLG